MGISSPELSKKITISYSLLITIIMGVFWTGYFYYNISTLQSNITNRIDMLEKRMDVRYNRQENKNKTLFILDKNKIKELHDIEVRLTSLETIINCKKD